MALILCIETATDACSVCLARDGHSIGTKVAVGDFQHASQLTVLVQDLMDSRETSMSQLDAVAVSEGPGSYTALRVGLSTAKGICYAHGIPLLLINSLKALATAMRSVDAAPNTLYAPMIDARRMEVYTALYDAALNTLQEAAAVIITQEFLQVQSARYRIRFAGNGAQKCIPVLQSNHRQYMEIRHSAEHLVELAEQQYQGAGFADLAYSEPFYLKPPNITTPKRIL